MDFGRFLPDVKNWTLGEIACAAGLVVLSAGAGYRVYRRVRRGSAPPDRTPPPHEPQDVLEESLDTPSVLQPNLQLLPTEHHQESSAVVLPLSAGEMSSAWSEVQFLSADSFSSQSESVNIRRYFLGMMRGPESRLCWFKTTKTRWLNHKGFPYYSETEDCSTGIQGVSGTVTEIISCHCMATVTVQLEDYVQLLKKVTCTFLYVGPDGQVDTSTWVQEENCNPPDSDAESEKDWETEQGLTPEEMRCPLLDRGVTDIGLKLRALRQAFSTLLASIHNQNFLFVVGKKIVMCLAAANNQDVFGVQLAYESLVRFLRKPSYQESIRTELFGAQLHHYNFLDVFYELLLFGYFGNGSTPEAASVVSGDFKFEGGFLERLFALISMWDVDVWEPAAEMYFTALVDQLTVLCEVLFSQPLELYSDPAALSSAVSQLLQQHVQLMLDTLEKL